MTPEAHRLSITNTARGSTYQPGMTPFGWTERSSVKSQSSGEENQANEKTSPSSDRSKLAHYWYRLVQIVVATLLYATGGIRASGRKNLPHSGGALLVSNHASHLDVFILGIPLDRPLNYVARSTLFFPPLGAFIRSVGGFPIQREGMGAQGLKETLKRLRAGGIVALFPEGTRSHNGELGEFKSGIAVLAARAKVPIIPAAVAGTFEAWPRTRRFPRPAPVRIHYGVPIMPEELAGMDGDAMTELIRTRVLDCQCQARATLPSFTGEQDGRSPKLALAESKSSDKVRRP